MGAYHSPFFLMMEHSGFVQLGSVQRRTSLEGGGAARAQSAGSRLCKGARVLLLRRPSVEDRLRIFYSNQGKNKRRPHAQMKANKRETAHRPPCFMVDCCGTIASSRAALPCRYILAVMHYY